MTIPNPVHPSEKDMAILITTLLEETEDHLKKDSTQIWGATMVRLCMHPQCNGHGRKD